MLPIFNSEPGPAAWVSRGNTLRSHGRFREALRCYDRAIDIDPSCADAWLEKGRLLQRMGHPDLALRRFERVLEIDPAREDARADIGRIRESLGRSARTPA